MIARLLTYGDQLIASPGPYNDFNVQKGQHWWEILAEHLSLEPVYLGSTLDNVGISPIWYLSKINEILDTMKENDKFVGFVPSAWRSLHWENDKPKHLITEDLGPHQYISYCEWQAKFVFDLLVKITKNKNVLFVQQNLNNITRGTKEVKVVRVEQHLKDFNWVWSWVIQETGIETNPNNFYKHYAPERKLNSKGHELVAKVMKKYVQ